VARVASEEARVKLQEYRDAVRGTKEATNSATIKKDGEFPRRGILLVVVARVPGR
jgi:hypothetical protein